MVKFGKIYCRDYFMKKLFEILSENLFSILSTYKPSKQKNKFVYADALFVLYKAFKTELQLKREKFAEMLQENLASELLESNFSDELTNDEENNIAGLSKFLVRRLHETGWIEFERGQDFEEYIILPDCNIKILKTFNELTNQKLESTFSYVYDTYSALKQADSEKDDKAKYVYNAIFSATKNTNALCELLSTVYHNINNFCKKQLDLNTANEVLSEHYDEFYSTIIEKYVKPLKIQESIPKYKMDIVAYIDNWLSDIKLLEEMAQYSYKDKNFDTLQACNEDLQIKLLYIKDSYLGFQDKYIKLIDDKVHKYTRTTTQKLLAFTNSDSNLKGNLQCIMRYLSKHRDDEYVLDLVNGSFKFSNQLYLSSNSLFSRKKNIERDRNNRLQQEETVDFTELVQTEIEEKRNSKFSKKKIREFAEKVFGSKNIVDTSEMDIDNDDSFILSLLMVVNATEKNCFYRIEFTNEQLVINGYSLPKIKFIKKV